MGRRKRSGRTRRRQGGTAKTFWSRETMKAERETIARWTETIASWRGRRPGGGVEGVALGERVTWKRLRRACGRQRRRAGKARWAASLGGRSSNSKPPGAFRCISPVRRAPASRHPTPPAPLRLPAPLAAEHSSLLEADSRFAPSRRTPTKCDEWSALAGRGEREETGADSNLVTSRASRGRTHGIRYPAPIVMSPPSKRGTVIAPRRSPMQATACGSRRSGASITIRAGAPLG